MRNNLNEKTKASVIKHFVAKKIPAWVKQLPGPFQEYSKEEIGELYLAKDVRSTLLSWTEKYMVDNKSNIAIPSIRYNGFKMCLDYQVLIGIPEETVRFARKHPSKDERVLPVPQKNVVLTPDIKAWRQQRKSIIDAFLPFHSLAPLIPKIQNTVTALVHRWQKLKVVDIKAEMHHYALLMFIETLLGVSDPFGVPSGQTTPKDSAIVRDHFNLEFKDLNQPKLLQKRIAFGVQFITSLFQKAKETNIQGHLMKRVLEIKDFEIRYAEMFALLVAGHDTTAYTMQFLFFELARHPTIQQKVRDESIRVLDRINASGRSIKYTDLPKFEYLTKCITETLRLWNVAMYVFGRVTTSDDYVSNPKGEKVLIPSGTPFNFWFYGHHHSKSLWEDPFVFNPDREFKKQELNKTPCTQRLHPFSLPGRDCLGKNFAMMEMRLLIPQTIRNFHLDLAEPTLKEASVKVGSGEVYAKWCRESGGTVQPHSIWINITPVRIKSHI